MMPIASSRQWTASTIWAAVFRKGLVHGAFRPSARGRLLGLRVQLGVVQVEAGQGADGVGVAGELGVLGRRVRHDELVGHLAGSPASAIRTPSVEPMSPASSG